MSAITYKRLHSARNAGFTLTEMLVVLLIIALATGTASITISQRSKEDRAVNFALELRELLSRAHETALIHGRTRTVQFDTKRRMISAEDDSQPLTIPDGIAFNLLVGRELVQSDGSVHIRFFGQGGSTGARFELTDAKGGKAVVSTNWLTGMSVTKGDGYAGN